MREIEPSNHALEAAAAALDALMAGLLLICEAMNAAETEGPGSRTLN